MNQKIKIAQVGVGRWGKKLLQEFLVQADIICVCHRGSVESTDFLKENYPTMRITTSLNDILRDNSIEAVVVVTPINTHFEIAKRVLQSGKHLFLEKPGGQNRQELGILVNEAKKRNLVLMIGYVFTYNPVLTKIKELLRNEKIKSLHFEWFKWGSFDEHIIPNLFPHDISIMLLLGIFPNNIEYYREYQFISNADILEIGLKNNEVVVHSYINRISTEKRKTLIINTNKNTYIWNNRELCKIDAKERERVQIEVDSLSTPVAIEIRDFLHSIKNNIEPKSNGEFGLKVFEVLEQIDYR